MFQTGDKVTWTSQSQGSTTTKTGQVHAMVPARRSAFRFLPADARNTGRKFDTEYADQARFIIAVPRGGKSTKVDYYCPRPSQLRKVE